jgi:DNA-directed RNA polymerase specialized sigma24 family protein
MPEPGAAPFDAAGHVEDLSQEEIARAAGVRLGTVKSRLHRALRRLRRELSEEVTP